MLVELASIFVPVATVGGGYAISKQLEINKKVITLEEKVNSQDESIKHVVSRIDAIYDHLVNSPRR